AGACASRDIVEVEPAAVGRAGAFAGADRGVVVIAIEERAVRRQMVEDAIENDVDPASVGVGHQLLEVPVAAEVAADRKIIAGVVAVVRAGLKDRIEIDDRDADTLQVVQLVVDSLQIAAEVVAALRAFGAWCGRRAVGAAKPLGQIGPLFVDDLRVGGGLYLLWRGAVRRRGGGAGVKWAGVVILAAVAEAVGE